MRLALMLCLVTLALLLCILKILSSRAGRQQPYTKTGTPHSSAVERLNDHYHTLRTVIDFPKSGLSVPANVYVLAGDPATATAIPVVRSIPVGSHFIDDDTLRVPNGSQCNLSMGQMQVFLNAGSKLAPVTQDNAVTQVTLSGEAYVKTGSKGCTVAAGDCNIRLSADSRMHITAYDDEPDIRICLGAGSASIQQPPGTQVLRKANDAVVIDKATGVTKPMSEPFTDVAAWTQGRLHGQDKSFARIYRQLSHLFDVPIVCADTTLLRGVYAIPYRDFTLQSILGTLTQAQHCHSVVAHDSIFITSDHPL